MRALTILGLLVVGVWVIIHALTLSPVQKAADNALTWLIVIFAMIAVIASLTVLGFGLVAGRTSPAWLRFVQHARTAAAVIGCALIVIGLLRYQDTQPHGEITWVVLGLAVLVGAGIVHGWVVLTQKKNLT